MTDTQATLADRLALKHTPRFRREKDERDQRGDLIAEADHRVICHSCHVAWPCDPFLAVAALRDAEAAQPRWHHSPDAPPEYFCEDCDGLKREAEAAQQRVAELEAALREIVAKAEADLTYEGEFIDYIVPFEGIDRASALLAAGADR
jgi:hypothetical protein